jgi:hypothetical protein
MAQIFADGWRYQRLSGLRFYYEEHEGSLNRNDTMKTRKPTHPGEILLEDIIKPLGITITEAARNLRISRKTLSEILYGKCKVNAIYGKQLTINQFRSQNLLQLGSN